MRPARLKVSFPAFALVALVALLATALPARAQAVSITTTALPAATRTVPYGGGTPVTLQASGGFAPYYFYLDSGSLPPGLSLATSGAISGTPTALGSYPAVFRVYDSNASTAVKTLTIAVYDPLVIPSGALPDGLVNSTYRGGAQAAGGAPPYAWSLTAGALPVGLSLASSGTVAGIPATAGIANFTLQVMDSVGATASRAMTLTVQSYGIPTDALSPGVLGVPYASSSPVLQASGGAAPYNFSIASGTLPAGLTLAATGVISGTPTALGASSVTFRVTDAGNATATKTLVLAVEAPPVQPLWSPRGNDGGLINQAVLSPNYLSDGTLFALNNQAELHRSTDRGANWSRYPVDPARMGYIPSHLLLSPVYDQGSTASPEVQTLFVVGSNLGVYRSVDHGQTFTAASNGLRGWNACTLPTSCYLYAYAPAISPNYASDHTVMMVQKWNTDGAYHLMRTVDGGANWSSYSTLPAAYNGASLWTMAISPNFASDRTLLVAFTNALLKSTDGGVSFTQIQTFGADELRFSPNYATDAAIMARSVVSGYGRILLSRNGGASFTTLPSPLYIPGYLNVEWTRRAGAPPLLVAYVQDWGYYRYRVAVSGDYGATFTPQPAWGLPVPKGWDPYYQVMWVAPMPVAGAGGLTDLFVATNSGLLASFDGGRLFAERTKGMAALDTYSADWQGAVAVACRCDRVLRSRDGGNNWSSLSVPSYSCTNYATNAQCVLSPNYANDRTLFYLDENGNLYRTTDGGRSFANPVSVGYNFAKQLKLPLNFNPATGQVYIATNNGLMRSQDGGVTFAAMTLPAACTASNHMGLALSPNFTTDRTLFLSSYPSGTLCKSTDAGATWAALSGAINSGDLAISPSYLESGANGTPQKTLFSANGGMGRVQRSTDGGATWTDVAGWPTYDQFAGTIPHPVVSPNYATDGTLFIYYQDTLQRVGSYGLWRSGDFGATATRVSANGGDQLLSRQVTGVALDPAFNGSVTSGGAPVVATTQGGGIFRSTDGGRTFAPANGYKFISAQVNGVARAAAPINGEPSPAYYVATGDEGIFRSIDEGTTFDNYSSNLPSRPVVKAVATPSPGAPPFALVTDLDGAASGLYRDAGNYWSFRMAGDFRGFSYDGGAIYVARADGVSYRSADNGLSWNPLQSTQTDLTGLDFNSQTTPTFVQPASFVKGPSFTTGNTASLWAVSAAGGPRWSGDAGSTWTATPGTNDYVLPSGQSWTVVKALGINPVANAREVIAGSSSGLFLSRDGGVTWKSVSGTGSGLELTSKNFSATLSTVTSYNTTDILVGAAGALNGGVYLSGDGGQHWTQVNQGFDPANLSISSLVKTSCAGCPVQYYSGTYGAGVYTRTISVNPPPQFPSVNYACAGAACACGSGPFSGPVSGGTAVTLCGSGFQNGLAVEFDGLAASGCAQSGGTTITCTATPPHAAGYALVRVRNPDTRAGTLPGNYQYTGGTSRASALYVAKSGANGWVSWNCAGCDATNPARLYRAQNPAFSLYLESYNGGASGTMTGGCTAAAGTNSCYNQTGTVGSAQSYFWSVE